MIFDFSSFWKPDGPYEVPVPFDAMYDDIDVLYETVRVRLSVTPRCIVGFFPEKRTP